MAFTERGDTLIELLEKLEKSDISYVLVGGYAISVFNPRFSTDLDIVIGSEEVEKVSNFLEQNGFELTERHQKDWFYDREVKEYKKFIQSDLPVGFDLLANGLGCRQTDAEWSFQYLYDHSSKREVKAGTKKTLARVADPEVLIAVKLHSGRETDLRDVTALVEEVDLEDVEQHLHRGDENALQRQLEKGLEILSGEELKHGYKSDFGQSSVPEESVQNLKDFLSKQIGV
ncbi:MAG: nucleotidyltransferase family protein [Candidatus Aenigmatarchaeota archaeon]